MATRRILLIISALVAGTEFKYVAAQFRGIKAVLLRMSTSLAVTGIHFIVFSQRIYVGFEDQYSDEGI
jgi:hypothetical protein